MEPTLKSEIDECEKRQKTLNTMVKMGADVSVDDQKLKSEKTDLKRKLELGPTNCSFVTNEILNANLTTVHYWGYHLGKYIAPINLRESIEVAEFFAHETRPVLMTDYNYATDCKDYLDDYEYLEKLYDETMKTISKNGWLLSGTDVDTLMYVHTHMRKIKDEVTAMCARSAEFESLFDITRQQSR